MKRIVIIIALLAGACSGDEGGSLPVWWMCTCQLGRPQSEIVAGPEATRSPNSRPAWDSLCSVDNPIDAVNEELASGLETDHCELCVPTVVACEGEL